MGLELSFMSLTPEAIVACLWLSLQNVSCMFNRFWVFLIQTFIHHRLEGQLNRVILIRIELDSLHVMIHNVVLGDVPIASKRL